MKNFLKHFRRTAEPEATAPAAPPAPAPPTEPPPPPDAPKLPAAPLDPVPHPSAMARGLQPVWHANSAPVVKGRRAQLRPERKAPAEMLTLTLGDFLDRIPPHFLDAADHDRTAPMPFDIAALSERIGRGETEIPVMEIYRRMPDIFNANTVIGPERTIRFPWGKVLALISQVRDGAVVAGLSPAALETLSTKLKARKLRRSLTQAQASRPAAKPAPSRRPASAESSAPSVAAAPAAIASPPDVSPTAEPVLAKVAEPDETNHEVATLLQERDRALTEIVSVRSALAEQVERTGEERRKADEISERFSLFQKEHGAIVAAGAALQSERDAAVASAAEFGAEHDAAISRTGELIAERDAAVLLASKAAAEIEAAVTRAVAATAERDALTARTEEATTTRDAAATRAAELTAASQAVEARAAEAASARDAALARVAELTLERDAALARANQLVADSDAAVALAAESTAERDAALARVAELSAPASSLSVTATDEPTAAHTRAVADLTAKIEGFRDSQQALTKERDALRLEIERLTAAPMAKVSAPLPNLVAVLPATILALPAPAITVAEKATAPSALPDATPTAPPVLAAPLPDVYSSLFPERVWVQRIAALLLLGGLGFGILSQLILSTPETNPAAPVLPAPAVLTPANAIEGEASASPAAPEAAQTLPAAEPLEEASPDIAAQVRALPPVTLRRAR